MREEILVTAALPYINNVPHMGHIAGSHLPADIFSRFCRLVGHDITFVGGSDEHGTPSAVTARELGLEPQDLADRLHEIHKKVYQFLKINYTNYSRTSARFHHSTVQNFFKEIYQRDFIHTGKTEMYYCKKDEIFLADRFVVGTCPRCEYSSAYGDQCESCGAVFSSNELVDPHCKICGVPPIFKESEHLYIDLEKLSGQLKKWVSQKKTVWRHHVYSEAQRWLTEGLHSRSITRDINWGIKVPLNGFMEKVFYVWFDAPIGYVTFTKELGENVFEKYWKNSAAKIYHFLGKDNIPFHTIFWPAMLLAHGDINLPWNIVGYNYLNYEGQKISKSKGVGIFCYNLLDSDIDTDMLRSYLTTIIPENKDSDFKWQEFKNTTNSELIGKLSNFFNRTLHLIWENFQGKLGYSDLSKVDDLDRKLISAIYETSTTIANLYMNTEFREAYKKIMEYATQGNIYIDQTAPWKLVKDSDATKAKKVLYLALNLCKSLAIVSSPIAPTRMQEFWANQLNFEGCIEKEDRWLSASKIDISADHAICKPYPLYQRIDDIGLEKIKQCLIKPHSLSEMLNREK